jgi:Uma2 family endonuclease
MAVAQQMSEQTYIEFVGSGAEGQWELHDGRLVEKPGMSWKHGQIPAFLAYLLLSQIDLARYRVVTELRVRRPGGTVYLPDLMVVPAAYGAGIAHEPALAVFSDPVLLVVEVWSPSTGGYDVDAKIPVYQQRGDLEIWRIHPYERTLTRWVRRPDGAYDVSVHQNGTISLVADSSIAVDLDRLFTL